MTQKLWLKKPTLQYSKNIFDIIQFGSSVKEEKTPNDIDIAVIFNSLPLKDQLNDSQEIKKQLQKILTNNAHQNTLLGKDVFYLHDTYGLQLEFTKILAKNMGLEIDEEGFKKCMDIQQNKGRFNQKIHDNS